MFDGIVDGYNLSVSVVRDHQIITEYIFQHLYSSSCESSALIRERDFTEIETIKRIRSQGGLLKEDKQV